MPPVAAEPDPETFGDALKRVMAEEKVSVRALARRLHELPSGKGQSEASWKRSVGRYREGKVHPHEKTIRLLAIALGVSHTVFPTEVGSRDAEIQRLRRRVADLEAGVTDSGLSEEEAAVDEPTHLRRALAALEKTVGNLEKAQARLARKVTALERELGARAKQTTTARRDPPVQKRKAV